MQISPVRPPQSQTSTPEETAYQTLTLDVSGMKCAGCVGAVERILNQNPGVAQSWVNLVTQVAVVRYDPQHITPQTLADRLTDRGFPAQIRPAHPLALPSSHSPAENPSIGVALVLLVLSSLGHLAHWGGPTVPLLHLLHHPLFHWGLATLAIAIPGREIFLDGWRGLRFGHANMNTLVALGTGSAYLTSCIAWIWPGLGWDCFFDEPVMLLGVLLLGRTLEGRARDKARGSLEKLMALRPALARLVGPGDGDNTIEIPVEQVQVGEWVRVLPGEKIPVDGVMMTGHTWVDESLITGESVPVVRQPGDRLMAGTWNQSGAVTLAATQVGQDTTLARIIQLVETAQTQKAPTQRLADRVAGWFAYGVMALAGLTLLFWATVGQSFLPLTPGMSPGLMAIKLSVSVLVVACPCALGLATPMAILVGTGLGAERGILLKGGIVLETLQGVTAIAFDKTGTLTLGKLQLTDSFALAPETEASLLTLGASLEQDTHHPLADGLVQAARNQQLPLFTPERSQTLPGQGVMGDYQGDRLRIGSGNWFTEDGLSLPPEIQTQAEQWQNQGKTVIFVARNQTVMGGFALQDCLRPDAPATIAALQAQGIQPLLLTGDHPTPALAIADQAGIPRDQVYAQMTPQGKVTQLQTLQSQGQVVAMVGDGINDAPALAQADVGLALAGGTEVALETADGVLMGGQLQDVLAAITLSRRTVRKIYQNLAWALGYNLLAIPLAAGVFLPAFSLSLTPAIAGALMASSSLMVVINALSLTWACQDFATGQKGDTAGNLPVL